jgi:hypothetical protein
MTLQSVRDQYADHIIRLHNRAHMAKRPLTEKEKLGVAFYKSAVLTLNILIEAPQPAWVNASGKFVRL